MSRLESFIRRLEAQRRCLDSAARLVAAMPGPALELGLGNGRTYDHLRARMPGREIFVFDRQVAAHPDCVPDADHMIVGDFRATLPEARAWLPAPAALAHCDIGSGDPATDAEVAAAVGAAVAPLMAGGAIIVADQAMPVTDWRPLPLPPGVASGRYFMYRA